jgi:hypothetical protein
MSTPSTSAQIAALLADRQDAMSDSPFVRAAWFDRKAALFAVIACETTDPVLARESAAAAYTAKSCADVLRAGGR